LNKRTANDKVPYMAVEHYRTGARYVIVEVFRDKHYDVRGLVFQRLDCDITRAMKNRKKKLLNFVEIEIEDAERDACIQKWKNRCAADPHYLTDIKHKCLKEIKERRKCLLKDK